MKILIIQQKMIGDVLTSSIMFEVLKSEYPKAELHYAINSHTYPVVEHNPFIDYFKFITPQIQASKLKLISFSKQLKKEKYDVVIDVYSKTSSNIMSWYSCAKIKVSKHKHYTKFIYDHTFVEAKKPKTLAGLAIENRLQLLEPLGISSKKIVKPKIYLTQVEKENAKTFLISHNINLNLPLYMISVIGSGQNKTYPFDYMAKVIDTIVTKKPKAQILFNYIPKQEAQAKAIYDLCETHTQNHIYFNVFGKSLRDFLTITHFCDALIGNEGGAVNMAKALDIATFTIFSPWIKKEAWSLFEDDSQNVSVHLKDYKPEVIAGKSTKELKSNLALLYRQFSPTFFLDKLGQFLIQ